ncbi:hypothetical protein [Cupriavidus taiwanensis]|nr:hypothetical protein [Cupriavidus taiwanensis]SPA26358.1 exported hypothetical protein [Cupriavidus taiwanensis]SPA50683.1 exported protein of unknown function [Cupriavidus taiwanensis]
MKRKTLPITAACLALALSATPKAQAQALTGRPSAAERPAPVEASAE